MGESRANLPDLLLTPASLPYEVGAGLSALMPRLCHYAIRLMVEAEPGSGMRLWSMRPAYVLLDRPVRQFPPVDFKWLERQLELGQMLMPVIRHHAANRAGGLPAPETPTQERMADVWAKAKDSHDTLTAGNFGERILRPALPVLHLTVSALHIINEEAARGNVIDWRQFLVNPSIITNWLGFARSCPWGWCRKVSPGRVATVDLLVGFGCEHEPGEDDDDRRQNGLDRADRARGR